MKQSFLTLSILAVASMVVAAAGDEWAGSDSCIECHKDRHESWYRTYHRTMTQEAGTASVLGRFDGEPVTYWGMTIRPVRRGGRFFFEYLAPQNGEKIAEYEVLRTVGSHRYQQYLTRVPGAAGTYYRLHLLWHIEDRRWVHMNGVFLGPDTQPFDAQVTIWNHNCIFCHNTGPEPGLLNEDELRAQMQGGASVVDLEAAIYDSKVAELGIACETCHGPGARHVAENQFLPTRWWRRFIGRDVSIVQPEKLPRERSVEVCGQCHGQRTPREVRTALSWLYQGPPYRAGDELLTGVRPVTIDTPPPPADPELYRKRFWADGTPRLTAYEYQGLRQSACYAASEVSCITCHSMHAGEPAGMLNADSRAGAPCLACHREIAADPAAHSRHGANPADPDCQDCHMPNIVYGVMTLHRSHRIEIPDPAAHTAAGRPNACNLCHLDRSPEWAAEQVNSLWPGNEAADVVRADGADPAIADGVASLYAGDPVQRAVTAFAIGEAVARGAQRPEYWAGHLLAAMTDGYPAIRRFAAQSLGALNAVAWQDESFAGALEAFDFIAERAARNRALAELLRRWPVLGLGSDTDRFPPPLLLAPGGLPSAGIDALQALGAARSSEISIGE